MEHLDLSSVFPGWQIVQRLGKETYKIERSRQGLTEQCALKVIPIPRDEGEIAELRNMGLEDAEISERYEADLKNAINEYDLMRMVGGGCPNIVCPLDLTTLPQEDGVGRYVLIRMELLTLLSRLKPISVKTHYDEKLLEEQVCRLGMDICHALKFCENRNVLHRNIRPDSIFVTKDGFYQLGDFASGRVLYSGERVFGSYTPPEVFNQRRYDKRSDLYSLGLTLYWMLNERAKPFMPLAGRTGRIPTMVDEEAAIDRRLAGREPLPDPAHGSRLLKDIVLKACAYAPEDRYQSAEEMRKDLEKALEEIKSISIEPPLPRQPRPDPGPGRYWYVAAAALALVGAACWLIFRS